MKKIKFLKLLDELIEADPGTLTGAEKLLDVEGWDSMTNLGLIALADEHFGLVLSADNLANCQTIADIIVLMGSHVSG